MRAAKFYPSELNFYNFGFSFSSSTLTAERQDVTHFQTWTLKMHFWIP